VCAGFRFPELRLRIILPGFHALSPAWQTRATSRAPGSEQPFLPYLPDSARWHRPVFGVTLFVNR